MATWPVPPHTPRSLTPIIELTAPASARSIRLPEVDHEYDYRDESPIPQRTNQLFQNKQMEDNDGDSVYSQGSTRTIVPAVRLYDRVPPSASNTSPPISPPANIRPLPSPSEGRPPPPRSLTSSVRDSTPRNTPPTSPGPILELNPQQRSDHGRHRTEEVQQQGEDEWDKASVATTSSAGIAGVGAGMKSTAPGPGTRPDSLQLSRQRERPEAPLRFATTFHSSLVNIPLVTADGFPSASTSASDRSTSQGGTPAPSRPSTIHESSQPSKRPDRPIRVASFQSALSNTPIVQSSTHIPAASDPISRRVTPRAATTFSSRPNSTHEKLVRHPTHDSPVQIAASHPSLAGIPVLPASGVPPGTQEPITRRLGASLPARPKSLHSTARAQRSGLPVRIASFHESLVNIPVVASPDTTPALSSPQKRASPSRRISPKVTPSASPTQSTLSSPKSRPSTLKKRPTSLHSNRPISWHSRKPVPTPDSTIKAQKSDKANQRSVNAEEISVPTSKDTPTDTARQVVRASGPIRRNSRIPSILLSLFEPNRTKLSRSSSVVTAPATSSGGHSPQSPITPNLAAVLENADESEIAGAAPPLTAIRTSGTFGIQDDGSVHLLRDDPSPRISISSTPGRSMRRRDSSGTVMSATIDRVLIMGNPDPEPRPSIDEEDEGEESSGHDARRSLTPFEPENPTSPLEIMLAANTSAVALAGSPAATQPEQKSVDGHHDLLIIPGGSDTSQRARSPTENSISGSTSRSELAGPETKVGVMVDNWTQTSRPTSVVSSIKRPLPRPPTRSSDQHDGPPAQGDIDTLPSRLRDRVRPTSLPPLSTPSAHSQAGRSRGESPSLLSPPPTADLPLLIASHLSSNHAAALMRRSAAMAEGAEMMKRMADESMQWSAMFSRMASGQAVSGGHVPSDRN